MKYKLTFSRDYFNDLAEIAHYITCDLNNPQAAEALADKIGAAILRRLEMPERSSLIVPKSSASMNTTGYMSGITRFFMSLSATQWRFDGLYTVREILKVCFEFLSFHQHLITPLPDLAARIR